jgi:hypothetical protein
VDDLREVLRLAEEVVARYPDDRDAQLGDAAPA